MRIDDHIWNDTFSCVGQVLLSVSHSASTLLSVTTSKLITNLWNFNCSHFDLCEPLVIFICCNDDLVNNTGLGTLKWDGAALELLFALIIEVIRECVL